MQQTLLKEIEQSKGITTERIKDGKEEEKKKQEQEEEKKEEKKEEKTITQTETIIKRIERVILTAEITVETKYATKRGQHRRQRQVSRELARTRYVRGVHVCPIAAVNTADRAVVFDRAVATQPSENGVLDHRALDPVVDGLDDVAVADETVG
ncbi:hypothetical protein RFI_20402 [Reticulomyxa filosa]|uniref:Uncharacterized protein n=1 Tax=Reticulomyxa filosa TaxID=46433 RepID=X6MV24_RETFI|nr:hypothetical protein RFI_20402 [Reticulomyxa filosa]|eukprot:ETO16935.1 hypothetical protein RFI_20402 [Reticulomyxa filosa]